MYRYLKDTNITIFDNVTEDQYFPRITQYQPTALDTQSKLTFHGQQFYNKTLFLNTDYANDICNVYDTSTAITAAYDISNMIATFNNTTGEWTYL